MRNPNAKRRFPNLQESLLHPSGYTYHRVLDGFDTINYSGMFEGDIHVTSGYESVLPGPQRRWTPPKTTC